MSEEQASYTADEQAGRHIAAWLPHEATRGGGAVILKIAEAEALCVYIRALERQRVVAFEDLAYLRPTDGDELHRNATELLALRALVTRQKRAITEALEKISWGLDTGSQWPHYDAGSVDWAIRLLRRGLDPTSKGAILPE